MAHKDNDGDGPNPSRSFDVGAADRLSGFFTPVWESKRRRSESERGARSPTSSDRAPGGPRRSTPPPAPSGAGSTGTKSESQPPRALIPMPPQRAASRATPAAGLPKVVIADGASVAPPPESEAAAGSSAEFIDAEPLPPSLPEPPAAANAQEPAGAPERSSSADRSPTPTAAAVQPVRAAGDDAPGDDALGDDAASDNDLTPKPPPQPSSEGARGASKTAPSSSNVGSAERSTPRPAAAAAPAAREQAVKAVPRPSASPPRPAREGSSQNGSERPSRSPAPAPAAPSPEPQPLAATPDPSSLAPTPVAPPAAAKPPRPASARPAPQVPAALAHEQDDEADPVTRRTFAAETTLPSQATRDVAIDLSYRPGHEALSTDWDAPDTVPPRALGASEASSPEAQLSHLLRRLRRTIPLYAPLPERIRQLIENESPK